MDHLAEAQAYTKSNLESLAQNDAEFKKLWDSGKGHLNFQDPEVVQTVTKASLRVEFGLKLEVPPNRLCPPVPNRWNYVAWIHRLLDSTATGYTEGYDPDRKVVGLDIGTGASAIYTLLCLRSRPNWTMCATDIDRESFDSAARNIALNNMMTRVKLLQTTHLSPIIPMQAFAVNKIDFVMCNPPFFTGESEMMSSMSGEFKNRKPHAICTGSPNEMVYPGGDSAFVARIINESLVLQEKVTWYSSLFGKMSGAKSTIDMLRHHGIDNYAVGSIDVGQTTRWIVAWSFGDFRPDNSIVRIERIADKFLAFPTGYVVKVPVGNSISTVTSAINDKFSSLDMKWNWNESKRVGIGEATQGVWQRWYRREQERKKRELEAQGLTENLMIENETVAIAFRIKVPADPVAEGIEIQWLRGKDRKLWESLYGMVAKVFQKPIQSGEE